MGTTKNLFPGDLPKGSSLDELSKSGVYIDHRDLASHRRPLAPHTTAAVSASASLRPSLPLTNRNLRNLQKSSAFALDSHSDSHADLYAGDQTHLVGSHGNDPFKDDPFQRSHNQHRRYSHESYHDDDMADAYLLNSLEFGGSNPSSDHSSDSTSLDDVCYNDYYDNDDADFDAHNWPDIKVLTEFVRDEIKELQDDAVQAAPRVNVEFKTPFVSEPDSHHGSVLVKPVEASTNEPIAEMENYQANELDESGRESIESFRIRPAPVLPWKQSVEGVPTILNNYSAQRHPYAPRYSPQTHTRADNKLCRFTYFREDLGKTVHSPTISGLISETNSSTEVAPLSDIESQHLSNIAFKLKNLFMPHYYSLALAPKESAPASIPATRLSVEPSVEAKDDASAKNNAEQPNRVTPFWLDILDPTEEEMKVLSKTFGIHPLTTEDIFLGEAREKVELFKSYYFMCFTSFDVVYERRKQRAKEQERKQTRMDDAMQRSGSYSHDNSDLEDGSNFALAGGRRSQSVWDRIRSLWNKRTSFGTGKRHSYASVHQQSRSSTSIKLRGKKVREGELLPLNMYIIVFEEAVITFHFSPTPHPINVRRRARLLRDYLTVSSDWICYALIDDITDSFAPLIGSIEDEVNAIEDAILKMHLGDSDDLDSDSDDSGLESASEGVAVAASGHTTGHRRSRQRKDSIFFRRERSRLTVDQQPRFKPRSGLRTSKSSSKSSLSSKSTGIIGWKRKGDMLRRIGECRKRVMLVYHLLGSKADVVKGFSKRLNETIDDRSGVVTGKLEITMYLGDIQDHLVTMSQSLSHYEKLLARFHANYLAQINIDMTQVNNETNDVLGKITILGTIVLPINVVTGLWGMNCVVPGQFHEGLTWFFGIVGAMAFFSLFAYRYASKVTGL